MASRSIVPGPDATENPLSLGKSMRQGPDPFFKQPAGLADAMRQGKSAKVGDSPKLIGDRMRQGGGGKKAKS
jgi:hypothetical protein